MEDHVIRLCNSLDTCPFYGLSFACKVIINGNKPHVLPCAFSNHEQGKFQRRLRVFLSKYQVHPRVLMP
jgi:hypothetical protein